MWMRKKIIVQMIHREFWTSTVDTAIILLSMIMQKSWWELLQDPFFLQKHAPRACRYAYSTCMSCCRHLRYISAASLSTIYWFKQTWKMQQKQRRSWKACIGIPCKYHLPLRCFISVLILEINWSCAIWSYIWVKLRVWERFRPEDAHFQALAAWC